jgi:hypothetical protein
MDAKRWPLIGIAALIPAIAAVALDFVLFYAELRVTGDIIEKHDRLLSSLSILLFILCGVMFIIAEVILWLIFGKTGALGKKELHIALLAGAVVYALIMAFAFPKSLDILYAYLPKSELSPGIMLLFFQLSSYIASALCGIVNAIGLRISSK